MSNEDSHYRKHPTEFDATYIQKATHAFEHGFPTEVDNWLIQNLDTFFFPLCSELAIHSAETLTTEKIKTIAERLPSPQKFLNITLQKRDRQALISFLYKYSTNITPETNREEMQKLLENISKEYEQLSAQLETKSIFNASDKEWFDRYQLVQAAYKDWDTALKKFDEFVEKYVPLIPKDGEVFQQFLDSLNAPLFASDLQVFNFPLSEKAEFTIHQSVGNIGSLFKDLYLLKQLNLPSFLEDETITEDLLSTLCVMIENIPHLQSSATHIAEKAPLFLTRETARGHDNPLDKVMMIIMIEGLVSITQSTGLTIAQLRNDSSVNMSDEELVELSINNQVPSQMARYLPAGHLGPATLFGHYMRDLFVLEDNLIQFNPKFKPMSQDIKKKYKAFRKQGGTFADVNKYLSATQNKQSITMYSGTLCPVSRLHPDPNHSDITHSGIDLLSQEFLRVFKEVRNLRKK